MLIKLKKAIYLKKIFGLFQFFYGGKRIQAIYHLRIGILLAGQYLLRACEEMAYPKQIAERMKPYRSVSG